jgi:hypothetical protein
MSVLLRCGCGVVAVLSDDTVERNVVRAKLFSRWARLSAIFYSLMLRAAHLKNRTGKMPRHGHQMTGRPLWRADIATMSQRDRHHRNPT